MFYFFDRVKISFGFSFIELGNNFENCFCVVKNVFVFCRSRPFCDTTTQNTNLLHVAQFVLCFLFFVITKLGSHPNSNLGVPSIFGFAHPSIGFLVPEQRQNCVR